MGVGDVPADALAALDGPRPLRPPARHGEHRPVSGSIGAEPADAKRTLVAGHDLDHGRSFMRVHHDYYLAHLVLQLASGQVAKIRTLNAQIGELGEVVPSHFGRDRDADIYTSPHSPRP